MQLSLKYDKPTCQGYHEKSFDDYVFNWELIYRIPRIATFETKIRIFQYNPFAPCAPLGGSQYRPTFGQQYLENGESKHCLCPKHFKKNIQQAF